MTKNRLTRNDGPLDVGDSATPFSLSDPCAPTRRRLLRGLGGGVGLVVASGVTSILQPPRSAVAQPQPPKDRLIRTFMARAGVMSVAFSPDGRAILSGCTDQTLKLWEVATGATVRTFTGHSHHVRGVAFSPDGRTALSASSDETLKLWDVASGKELRTFTGHSGILESAFALTHFAPTVAFSLDGRTALSGGVDDTLKLWDVASGKELRTFTGHSGMVESVAFSPDGRTALSAGDDDKTMRLWEVATGKELRRFMHSEQVKAVAFSRDGRIALSGTYAVGAGGNELRLWEVATGKELGRFMGHWRGLTSVAVAPDGRTAVSASLDTTLRLWDLTGL